MCGIVGYIGKKQASPILLDGLKRLEYRGYDSAGMAVWAGNSFGRLRGPGKVSQLAGQLNNQPLAGTAGIAHTRWATHGVPSEANAHPHADVSNEVYVVHNGIIENYQALQAGLKSKGVEFTSETDSEVLAHLVKKFLGPGVTIEEAVRLALRLVQGTYALLVMAANDPDKIVAARQSSPLRLGVGNDEFIIASDPSAIARHTRQVVTLNDGELLIIDRNGYYISELNGENGARKVERSPELIDWNLDEADRGGYEHHMLKEIFEQPDTIRNSMRGRLIIEDGQAKLGGLSTVEDRLRGIKRLHIVACGTASYAAMVGEYMLEEYAGVPAEVSSASEFRYRKPILDPTQDAVLVLSQSGETADTLAAVREAKEKGVMTLGIVNVIGSSIARETDAGVYNHAGPEIGVATTKVFTSQLTVLALLTLYLGRQRGMSMVMGNRIGQELLSLPDKIEKILEQSDSIAALAKKYSQAKNFFFLGRKYNFPLALEGALKLKEISYIHAEGTASGELKHGPLALVEPSFPSFFIAPQDSVYAKNISNMEEVKARQGKVLVIATEGDEQIKSVADDVIYIPKTLEMLTPILTAIPLQVFAYYLANELGRDVDKPRNLAKSVTVE
ncbi:glutamine--fructose-6-phosphate transaminase (isomerizing) [bacterium]|nr:glutamine--fructose-6-phosphate transaminase (isomerizing) [bacterium]